MTNRTIGHYQVLEKIGEGGMGAVYKARDTKLSRFVALKVLAAGRAGSVEMRQRFRQEAQAASALGHANIVVVHDIIEHDGAECIVMEFIEGQTLEQKLQAGPMRLRDALRCAAQVADALAAAHKAGVIHRDLKPGNIMLTGDGVAKVVDFGLAKLTESRAVGDETETLLLQSAEGTIAGTAAYMSPEQAEGQKLDTRSDIFSFGAVLYEMVTGKRAFNGASRVALITAVIRDEPAPLSKTLPGALQMAVQGCLRKEAARRFQHAADVRMVLERAAEELDSGVSVAPAPVAAPKRNWMAWAMLAAGLAGGGAAAYWMRPATIETPPMRFTRLTYGGRSFAPAISRDGKLVAYASSRPDGKNMDIWLQQVAGGGAIRLTDHPAKDSWPEFSADGSRVYFRSERAPAGIYEVSTLGGEARLTAVEGGQPKVSPDGKWLGYHRGRKLAVRPLPSGDEKGIGGDMEISADFGGSGRFCWSPDSTRILAMASQGALWDFRIIPLDGSPSINTGLLKNLLGRGMVAGGRNHLEEWLPNGEVHFSAPSGESEGLWALPLDRLGDGTPRAVLFGPGRIWTPRSSGGKIVMGLADGLPSAWMIPGDPDRGVLKDAPVLLAETDGMVEFPDIRPDGSKFLFTKAGAGYETMLLDRATGKVRSLPVPPSSVYGTLSPDGSQVAVATGEGNTRHLYTVPTNGGPPVRRSEEILKGRVWGWSADGNYVLIWRAFGGERVAAVLDLRTGKISEVLTNPGGIEYPRFSPDGKWIAFRVRDRMHIAPFNGATVIPESSWLKIADGVSHIIWPPDGNSIYYTQTREETAVLMWQKLDSVSKTPVGAPSVAFRFDPSLGFRLEDTVTNRPVASRDGIVVRFNPVRSDIWLASVNQ